MKRVSSFIMAALVALGLCAAPADAAPKYPAKPINLLCVFGPGGAADLGLRVVAEYATKHVFTMNVVNMPGGSGTQAAMQVLNTRADGYNVLFGSTGLVSLPIMKKVGYTIHSFTPVADITDMPLTFCVRTDSGITSFEQWMGEAKKNPGQYSYGSPGSITSQRQFLSVLIKDKFPDVSVNHVPYGSGWTGYTWNKELFPDPARFMRDLHRRGMKITLNLHPADGVQPHEEAYNSMCQAMDRDPQQKLAIDFDATDERFMQAYFTCLHHPL